MKLNITITPEDKKDDSGIIFNVELAQKHFDIAKHSVKLVNAVKSAIENIKEDLNKEE